jgi:TonB family protein
MGGKRLVARLLLATLVMSSHPTVNFGHDYSWAKQLSVIRGSDDDQNKEFASPEGGFSALFPKKPTESVSTLKVDNSIVKVHTFTVRDGSTYEISYFDVPHAADDAKVVMDLLIGLRNYVVTTLNGTLVSEAPLRANNNEGRILEISVAERGIARAIIIVTESRLYRISVVPKRLVENSSNEATNSAALRFLQSFKLLTIDRSGEGEVEAYIRQHPELARKAYVPAKRGDLLNGRALALPAPDYPTPARMARACGTVVVKIVIDEEGNVVAAEAISGHPSLQWVAVKAARRARFTKTFEQGQPVKVLGQVSYNFVCG